MKQGTARVWKDDCRLLCDVDDPHHTAVTSTSLMTAINTLFSRNLLNFHNSLNTLCFEPKQIPKAHILPQFIQISLVDSNTLGLHR